MQLIKWATMLPSSDYRFHIQPFFSCHLALSGFYYRNKMRTSAGWGQWRNSTEKKSISTTNKNKEKWSISMWKKYDYFIINCIFVVLLIFLLLRVFEQQINPKNSVMWPWLLMRCGGVRGEWGGGGTWHGAPNWPQNRWLGLGGVIDDYICESRMRDSVVLC